MDTEVGADEWPSGDQVWNGNKAPSTPNPTNVSGKNNLWADIGIETFDISRILKVSCPPPGAELKYIPNIPTRRSADPPMSIMVSFIAEYSLGPLPQIPIKRYIGITASS
jgi:hypothetical protein